MSQPGERLRPSAKLAVFAALLGNHVVHRAVIAIDSTVGEARLGETLLLRFADVVVGEARLAQAFLRLESHTVPYWNYNFGKFGWLLAADLFDVLMELLLEAVAATCLAAAVPSTVVPSAVPSGLLGLEILFERRQNFSLTLS